MDSTPPASIATPSDGFSMGFSAADSRRVSKNNVSLESLELFPGGSRMHRSVHSRFRAAERVRFDFPVHRTCYKYKQLPGFRFPKLTLIVERYLLRPFVYSQEEASEAP